MNNLAELIFRFKSEPYYFSGVYWIAPRATDSPMPFGLDCEFKHEKKALVVDGKYRPHAGGAQHPFQLVLPMEDALRSTTSVHLSTPALGTIQGRIFVMSGGVNFLARTNSAALSAHLLISEREVISLAGVLEIDDRSFGYSLKGTIANDRATLSNVVGISKGRRSRNAT